MQSADADRVLQAFHAGGRDCSDCHRFHDPGVILAGEARFHAGGSERQACVACHVPGRPLSLLSRGHREAASLYHADGEAFATRSASDLCLTCHGASGAVASAAATRGGASVVASLSAGAPRFREEATHPFGIEVTPGSDLGGSRIRATLDPRIRLFDGRIECATCHDLTEAGEDNLVRFEPASDELCAGCHDMGRGEGTFARAPGGIPDAAGSLALRSLDR